MPSTLENAQQLAGWGFNVLPARGKSPTVKWGDYQSKRSDPELSLWFKPNKRYNYWVNCGRISGWICLDCDSDIAEGFWRNQLGDELLDSTACVKTSKGYHYWFRIDPDGEEWRSWSQNNDQKDAGILFDVRSEGTGAIVPPSVHESGHVYEWVRDPSYGKAAPEALRGPQTAEEEAEAPQARTMLAHLLSNPPEGEGGRNNWLARVCGHYAKQYAPNKRDAYDYHVREAADKLDPPLPDEEAQKTFDSLWKKECAKGHEELVGVEPDEKAGFLLSGGDTILTECVTGKGKNAESTLEVWGDFDMRAVGVVEDDDARRVYDVRVHRRRQGDVRHALLPAPVLADGRALNSWLAELGVSILPPPGMVTKSSASQRLTRYIEAQDPPHFKVVPHLGWDHDVFIAHEGNIDAEGLAVHTDRKPHPILRNRAPYRYGYKVGRDEAVEVLREVLTFHDETICSVYGAWWAACLLKGQIEDSRSSTLFPFMAIAAPSESGKTNGFLPMMVALSGNIVGNDSPTVAELRDSLSSNRSGIVWIDDKDSTEHYRELVRQATSGGTVSKKGEDRTTSVRVKLVNPLMLTGEALTVVGVEKASIDRAVQLDLPSPVGRRSVRNPARPQFDDVVRLARKYPDMTDAAGTLLSLAMEHANLIDEMESLQLQTGRFAEKTSILRLGARVLTAMTGDPVHTERVDVWAHAQEEVGNENALTLSILPRLLAATNMSKQVQEASGEWPITPVVVVDGHVWFNVQATADHWNRLNRGKDNSRTADAKAIEGQARRVEMGGRKREWEDGTPKIKRFKVGGNPNVRPWFWSVGPEMSELLIERAEGGVPSRVSKGSLGGVQRGMFLPTESELRSLSGDVDPDD